MNRLIRGAAVIAAGTLLLAVSAVHWLGLQLPSAQPHQSPASRTLRAQPSVNSPDPYDVMGTLTFRGRTILSARLAPGESSVLGWLDDSQVRVVEVRPVGGWPSDRTSLPDVLRGVAVVHEFLVPTSTDIYDVVPVAAPLDVSVCTLAMHGASYSYRLKLVGRIATFDYPESLYFVTYLDTLLITTNGEIWDRLRQSGGNQASCEPG